MSFAPVVLLWVMLAATAAALVAVRRLRFLAAVAVAVPLFALPLWYLARPPASGAPVGLLGWQMAAGEPAWQLSGVVIWLLLAAVARMMLDRDLVHQPNRSVAAAFALAAAALPALYAADGQTQVAAVALFAAVWALGDRGASAGRWLWLAAAVFLLWAGAVGGSTFALLAAALLLGLWPLDGWRGSEASPGLSVMRLGLPVVIGAAVLSATAGGGLAGAWLAAATALGLLSLLIGLARLRERSTAGLARPLAGALAGLALVAAAWAGETALLAAARLAVFAPAALLLVPRPAGQSATGSGRAGGLLPSIVVYAALAGLPLTVGFAVLARLYAAWPLPGGLVLIVATAALLSLWLAALYLSAALSGTGSGRVAWLNALPALLTVIGLIAFDTTALDSPPLVWAAVLVPAVAGGLLGRFVPGLRALPGLLREALAPGLPLERLAPARRVGAILSSAIADAAALLEGANGLLFLLALIVLLVWIGL